MNLEDLKRIIENIINLMGESYLSYTYAYIHGKISWHKALFHFTTIGAHTHAFLKCPDTHTGVCVKRRYKQQTKIEIKRNGEKGWGI